jgi:hypothetical protein
MRLARSSGLVAPVVQEVERDGDQGGEEGEDAPSCGVVAAVLVGVSEDQHREPCSEHDGDQEIEETRLGQALKGERHLSQSAKGCR